MKCFIASGFGHEDVDAIYERCVVPTLRKLSVTPLRVDRVEHNEDIDKKIFELLDSADLVIADLTYARPSVYYEAGYAAGKPIPVIYIARSDHFKARDADPQGNLRVHFDLQMRNIIEWKVSDHRAFTNKLLKRIEIVLRPLVRNKEQRLKVDQERTTFNSLPVFERLGKLQGIARGLLHAESFKEFQPEHIYGPKTYSPGITAFLVRVNKDRCQAIRIIVTASTSKQLFQYFSNISLYFQAPRSAGVRLVETHYIVASLNSVPRARVTEALPNFHQLNDTTLNYASVEASRGKPAGKTYLHVIHGIKSGSQFEASFRKVIDGNGLTKGA